VENCEVSEASIYAFGSFSTSILLGNANFGEAFS
jgi:hypothetical protein